MDNDVFITFRADFAVCYFRARGGEILYVLSHVCDPSEGACAGEEGGNTMVKFLGTSSRLGAMFRYN